jgi:hypothetical protein
MSIRFRRLLPAFVLAFLAEFVTGIVPSETAGRVATAVASLACGVSVAIEVFRAAKAPGPGSLGSRTPGWLRWAGALPITAIGWFLLVGAAALPAGLLVVAAHMLGVP